MAQHHLAIYAEILQAFLADDASATDRATHSGSLLQHHYAVANSGQPGCQVATDRPGADNGYVVQFLFASETIFVPYILLVRLGEFKPDFAEETFKKTNQKQTKYQADLFADNLDISQSRVYS